MISLSPEKISSLWNELGRDSAVAVFLGDCYLHFIEARVAVEHTEGMDEMEQFVLRALEFARPANLEQLDAVLHLGRQIIRHLLGSLAAKKLVYETASVYQLTEDGERVCQTGRVVRRDECRRLFHFLHPGEHFVAICDPRGKLLIDLSPQSTPSYWRFNLESLRRCIAATHEWKQDQRFPLDVVELLCTPSSKDIRTNPDEAQRREVDPVVELQPNRTPEQLVVDKAQSVMCAIVVHYTGEEPSSLAAYAISRQGNLLSHKENPLFSLSVPAVIRNVFPTLSITSTSEQLDEAWTTLAAYYGVQEPETATVRQEGPDLRLAITLPLLESSPSLVAASLEGRLAWHLPATPFRRLCNVTFECSDHATAAILDALHAVLELEAASNRSELLQDIGQLEVWLHRQFAEHRPSLREMAETAFRFTKYRLSYDIAELEDMQDAAV